jgi:hypothetical protein
MIIFKRFASIIVAERLKDVSNRDNNMRKLTVSIPDELDEKVRAYVERRFGGIKGGLSMFVKEALEEKFARME